VPRDFPLGQRIMPVEQQPPLPVAQLHGSAGGADNVSEQHARQHAIRFGD
jgi:hypothetical protein